MAVLPTTCEFSPHCSVATVEEIGGISQNVNCSFGKLIVKREGLHYFVTITKNKERLHRLGSLLKLREHPIEIAIVMDRLVCVFSFMFRQWVAEEGAC